MEKLLQYRFQDGMLKGQSFGNLFLAAMDGISSSFEQAVQRMSDVLAVKGRVLPVTLEDIQLCAELEDGYVITGESQIGNHNSFHRCAIKRVYLEPGKVKPLDEVIEAIGEADVIVLGPGSLFTSIIPNLLVDGVCDAIKKSKALKIYVCNVMTQPGETDGYSVSDHIKALERHSFEGIVDYCIFNTADIPELLKKKYSEDGAQIVRVDYDELDTKIYIKTNIFHKYFGSFSAVIAVPFLTKLCKFIRRSICPRNFYLNIHAKYSNKNGEYYYFLIIQKIFIKGRKG